MNFRNSTKICFVIFIYYLFTYLFFYLFVESVNVLIGLSPIYRNDSNENIQRPNNLNNNGRYFKASW